MMCNMFNLDRVRPVRGFSSRACKHVFHGTDLRSGWAFIPSVARSADLARLALEINRNESPVKASLDTKSIFN